MNIEHCINELGGAIVPIKGTSMLPLLDEKNALVEVDASNLKELKKGDVILFKENDGTLILHRIIEVESENVFKVLGDNQTNNIEQVNREQIIAVAKGFIIKGRYVNEKTLWYRIYKKIWLGSLTLRRCCLALLRHIKK